ncbi:helix-turn-helix transcriptional regulator [Xenorhabdus griffiniae]|uniref:helix-turn-helix transcriptional regulator n=1 Tax=Xenorhabdus griffiniae TaxID=351672 RepID=UPI002359A2F4|nr:hypothetical protein [Xenorhabdus griffiniae]MDC9607106.1 hypothetical protein [Xenorhabdus griffiniae]
MDKDLISENDVFGMLGKKRTAVYRLRKKYGFPEPVLSHPARYRLSAVRQWIDEGGVNRKSVV